MWLVKFHCLDATGSRGNSAKQAPRGARRLTSSKRRQRFASPHHGVVGPSGITLMPFEQGPCNMADRCAEYEQRAARCTSNESR